MKEKNKLYVDYMDSIFGKAHNPRKIDRDYRKIYPYFRKNYHSYLPKNKRAKILDIGSGMGHFLYFLKKEGFINSSGLDTSKQLVDFCISEGFDVIEADAIDYMSNTKEMFDVVVMNDIIEHLTKDQIFQLLPLVKKRLKTDGILLIKTFNMSNPITSIGGRYIDITHEVCFTEESLAQVCHIAGFRKIKIAGLDLYVYYLNPLNYIAKLTAAILSLAFRILFLMYGRTTTKIFTKNILAVCRN